MTASSPPPDDTEVGSTGESTKRRPWDVPPGIAAIIVAVVGVVAAVVAAVVARTTAGNSTPQPGPTVTITASPSTRASSGTHASTHYYLKVNVPQAATRGNPLPRIGCHAVVSGQAQFPPGYGIVIANRISQPGKEWYFVPNANWSGHQWSQTIYFGAPQDTGSRFRLAVFAMPKSWRGYLATMFNEAKPSGGGWVYQNLPPSPMYVTRMTVRRSDKACS